MITGCLVAILIFLLILAVIVVAFDFTIWLLGILLVSGVLSIIVKAIILALIIVAIPTIIIKFIKK